MECGGNNLESDVRSMESTKNMLITEALNSFEFVLLSLAHGFLLTVTPSAGYSTCPAKRGRMVRCPSPGRRSGT